MAVSWEVASCSLVEAYRRFRPIALMMEAANIVEISVNITRLHGATSQKTVLSIFAP
jgi:hypothetical protein